MSETNHTTSELRPGDAKKGEYINSLIMAGLSPSEATDAVLNDNSLHPTPPDPPEGIIPKTKQSLPLEGQEALSQKTA